MDHAEAAIIRSEAERQAASGNRGKALEILKALRSPGPDAATAILQAKILSQLGDFASASEHWRAALSAEPENAEAKRGLALAEKLARSAIGGLRLRIRKYVFVLGCVAAVAAAAWAVVADRNASNARFAELNDLIQRQRLEDRRDLAYRNAASAHELRLLMESNQAQLEALSTEQARISALQAQQQRKQDLRSADLLAAIKRLEAQKASPNGAH